MLNTQASLDDRPQGDTFEIQRVLVDEAGLTQLQVESITVTGRAKAKTGWLKPLDRGGNLLVKAQPVLGTGVFEQEERRPARSQIV
jgi:hypothetical protein